MWPMCIYKALPLYSGFGFTFSKAAGGKMIDRENSHLECPVHPADGHAVGGRILALDELYDPLAGFLRPSITVP